LPQSKNS